MKGKGFLTALLTILMSLGLSFSVFAAGNDTVSQEEAYNVAINFILGNIASEVPVDVEGDLFAHGYTSIQEKGFPEEFAIQKVECFYNSNQEVSAYYMPVIDANGTSRGYVIVSANKEEYPIIEYSFDGTFYMEEALDKIAENEGISTLAEENADIFYLGGLCYATNIDKTAYIVNDSGYEKVSSLDTLETDNTNLSNGDKANIHAEWEALEIVSGGSNPPVGQFITAPDNYESGYSSKTADYCAGMGSSYYIMTDFSSGGVCTPTAGTNLCLYWTRRNSGYSNLCAGTWQNTFKRIYTLMGTSTSEGTTWPSPARTGILNYFKERGLSNTEAYYSTCTSTTHFNDYIKAEINVGRPVLIALWNDARYGNHTVLGLGYTRYMYNGVYSSHYIRITDGWSSTVDRYVHYETGRDSITRIRVIPG